MPAVLQLRIRTCHLRGSFVCRDNAPPPISTRHLLAEPAAFDYAKLAHPPVTYQQERRKMSERLPAARRYIADQRLNERMGGERGGLGLIVQRRTLAEMGDGGFWHNGLLTGARGTGPLLENRRSARASLR